MQPIITGIILSGGQGTRMGHLNKGLQTFGGTALIEHVINRLKNQVDQIVISANKDINRYEALGYPVWQDNNPSRGPLSGFLTGLENCSSPYIMVVPCDTPLLPVGIVIELIKRLQDTQTDLCMPATRNLNLGHLNSDAPQQRSEPFRVQPTFCLLKKSLAPSLREFLNNGGSKVQAWTSQQNSSYLQLETPPFGANAFVNLNTLEELKATERDVLSPKNSISLD